MWAVIPFQTCYTKQGAYLSSSVVDMNIILIWWLRHHFLLVSGFKLFPNQLACILSLLA